MNPVHNHSILTLFYSSLGLSNGLFTLGFPTKTLNVFVSSSIHAAFPAYLILFDFDH
jgi:hypothetical protein